MGFSGNFKQLPSEFRSGNMADDPNFDIGLDSDSDESLFITKQPSQARINNDLDQSVEDIDLENILKSTKDSAFNGDSSFKAILGTKDS